MLDSNTYSNRVLLASVFNGNRIGLLVYIQGAEMILQKLKQPYVDKAEGSCIFDVGANNGQFLQLILDGLQVSHPIFMYLNEVSMRLKVGLRTSKVLNVRLNNLGVGKGITV